MGACSPRISFRLTPLHLPLGFVVPVPAVSSYLVQQIEAGKSDIKFTGAAIGNGWGTFQLRRCGCCRCARARVFFHICVVRRYRWRNRDFLSLAVRS